MAKKHWSALFLGTLLTALVSMAGFSGCEDDDTGVVATSSDCGTVCSRYQTCFNPAFDVGACTNQCQAQLGSRVILSSDIDDCMECIGENMCSAQSDCRDDCDDVVVVQ